MADLSTIDGLVAAWRSDPNPFIWRVLRDAVRDFGECPRWWRERVLGLPDSDSPRLALWALVEDLDPTAAAFGRAPAEPFPGPVGWLEEIESERVLHEQLSGFRVPDGWLNVLPGHPMVYPHNPWPWEPVPPEGEVLVWFRFGFVDGVVVWIEDYFRVVPALFRAHPIRAVFLRGVRLHNLYPNQSGRLCRTHLLQGYSGWREDTDRERWGPNREADLPPVLFGRIPGPRTPEGYKVFRRRDDACAALSAACVAHGREQSVAG